ncbi:N-6 DNA methylase, partial [Saccharopolyspora sp. NPDC002686]|uniref:HsdM family class I SAM-dependent methyltransferase n=1 Tax=Saccharopolyspora sp. NPDC002686 TaxID=3154541 RepID=UPI00332F3265
MTDWLSASQIAQAAGVGRAAVSNWRERNADFPEPRGGHFSALEVAAWLDKRRIPRNALGENESEEATYGDRFRRAVGLADRKAAATPRVEKARVKRTLWLIADGLRDLRGTATAASYQELVLALLYARRTEMWQEIYRHSQHSDHRELVALLSRLSDSDPLFEGLRFNSEIPPRRLIDIIDALHQDNEATRTTHDQASAHLLEHLLEDFSSYRKSSEFHTPRSIVELAIKITGPSGSDGVYDPCCGDGALLVGAVEHIREQQPKLSANITGRALSPTSWRITSMNLTLHGVEPDLGHGACDVLQHDPDRGSKFDVILTNPPFNMRVSAEEIDPRWRYGPPPRSSANFAWMQHVLDKLAPGGRAVMVMPPAATTAGGREARIRRRLIEDRTVEAVIELPPRLFVATGIAVDLWLLRAPSETDGRVLFVSAADRGRATNRNQQYLAPEAITEIFAAHQQHIGGGDVLEPGFARSVSISEIGQQDYLLQPRTYLSSPRVRSRPAEVAAVVTEQRQQLTALAHRAAEMEGLVARQLDRGGQAGPGSAD